MRNIGIGWPVNVDAGFGEHEVPEVHLQGGLVEGGHGVVDEEAAVGQPQQREDGHHHDQHLDHLQDKHSLMQKWNLETSDNADIDIKHYEQWLGVRSFNIVSMTETNGSTKPLNLAKLIGYSGHWAKLLLRYWNWEFI